jgi:hypothetical protein
MKSWDLALVCVLCSFGCVNRSDSARVSAPPIDPVASASAASVGDVACYRNSKGEMAHCGFVVGVVQLRKPSKPDGPVGGLQIGWLSADGGQPHRTTEFQSGASGWLRYYSPPRNREAAFVLPRLFVQLGDGRASVQNLFIFPPR